MRRKRRDTDAGDFSDPLKDYSAADYTDDLERSLSEDEIKSLQITPFDTISPETTVREAMQRMAEIGVACYMVTEDKKLVGVFTERDVLDKVAARYDELVDGPVSAVMTTGVVVAYQTDFVAKAINYMAIGGFRHIPVLDVDDNVVGILGPRRVTAYLQEHFS